MNGEGGIGGVVIEGKPAESGHGKSIATAEGWIGIASRQELARLENFNDSAPDGAQNPKAIFATMHRAPQPLRKAWQNDGEHSTASGPPDRPGRCPRNCWEVYIEMSFYARIVVTAMMNGPAGARAGFIEWRSAVISRG